MSLAVEMDFSGLMVKMRKLAPLLGREMKGIIRQQAGILIADGKTGLIGITPPSNDKQKGIKAKKAGEAAVQRDIRRVYAGPSALYAMIEQRAGKGIARGFWRLVKDRQWTAANDIAEKHTGYRLKEFDDGAEHQKRRGSQGRVKGRQPSVYVVEPRHVKRYTRDKQKLVGLMASGWAKAGQRAGLTMRGVPAWVLRHIARGSGYHRIAERADAYTLTLANSTPYGKDADLKRRMRAALMYRRNAITRGLPHLKRALMAKAALPTT